MEIKLSELQLCRLLEDAAEAGSSRALAKAGLIKPTMRKQEACRIYGRAKIESLIKAGKIKKSKDGRWDLDRVMLESLHRSSSPIYK